MDDVERLTRQIGRQLFSLARKESRPLIKSYWWKEKMMMWFMADPEQRIQLLRFIDVFPVLRSRSERMEHLREYFKLIKIITKLPLAERALDFVLKRILNQLARHLILSSSSDILLAAIRKLEREGIRYTIDLLGDTVLSEKEADFYMNRYLGIIKVLKDSNCRVDISLKLSSLYSQFDPLSAENSARAVKIRLRKILRAVKEAQGAVTVDMESYYYRDLTLKIFMEIFNEEEFRDFQTPGIVLQCYLRDSEETLRQIIDWAQKRSGSVKVRLVKGAYWDTEIVLAQQKDWPAPVFTQKWETDVSFEKTAFLLLESENIILATGTHNIRSLARVIAEAENRNLPKERMENQFLWGMGIPQMKAVKKTGYPAAVYLPCGEALPGMSFLVRRVIENTSQSGFIFQSLGAGISIEELLKNPEQAKGVLK